MAKLCLKKFLWMLAYGALFFAVYLLGFNILTTFANFFGDMNTTYLIVAFVPASIIAAIVHWRRVDNIEKKRKYIADVKDTKVTFKSKAAYIFKSQEFRAEMIASMPIVAFIAISVSSDFFTAWYMNLFLGIFAFCYDWTGFVIWDFAVWYLVHRYWRKNSIYNF